MNNLKTAVVLVASLLSMNSAMANGNSFGAQNIQSTSNCLIPKIDGERVPFPIRSANTKFELSPNQTYLLNGTLVQMQGQVFFKVDFDSQPWLATEKLLEFPYFQMPSVQSRLVTHYSGALVQIAVVAQANDASTDPQESATSSMQLNLILAPAAL